jgi:3-hydroxyacyl-CoA dehydrogenase
MPTMRQDLARDIPVGVVGLGLMGTSIATCLVAAGHPVVGVDLDRGRRRIASRKVASFLREMRREGLLRRPIGEFLQRFTISQGYEGFRKCRVIVEAIFEDLRAKRRVLRELERNTSPETILASNTSALPISLLQKGLRRPEWVLGVHWAEPAHVTRFMEVICGRKTAPQVAERVMRLAWRWGKEPSLVRRDVRGFLTNRVMYAMLREAFHLVEAGYATVADVDRSLRNDLGYWITFAGPFRFMDLTGIPAYAEVMRGLLPELSTTRRVPRLMKRVVAAGARGVSNAKGFYPYTPSEARRWERRFLEFSYDIRRLAEKYREGASTAPRARRA